jgi:WD40 repeat protein
LSFLLFIWFVAALMGVVVRWNPWRTVRILNHGIPVNAAAQSLDGRWIATAGTDGRVVVWDAATGACKTTITASRLALYDVSFSPNANELAVCGDEGRVTVWDLETGHQLAKIADHAYMVYFSSDGRQLAVFAVNSASVWDVGRHEKIGPFDSQDSRWLDAMPRRMWYGVCHLELDQETVRVTNLFRGRARTVSLSGHSRRVTRADFSADGQLIVTSSTDGTARVWKRAYPADPVGHLARPEVWLAAIFGLLWLWRVVAWLRRHWGGDSAPGQTPVGQG